MVKTNEVAVLSLYTPSQGNPDDPVLLAAIGKGDTAALGVIFDRHHLAVHRFICRLAGADHNDVDDLLQNTFIEVAKSARRCQLKTSVKNWIFGIAANVVRRHVQRGVRHRKILAALKTVPPPPAACPCHQASNRETLQQLEHAIEQLPYKLKLPFIMYEVEGISGVEIAQILHLRNGTLWRRLHEARQILLIELKRVTP